MIVPTADLKVGDVLMAGQERLVVLSEPMTMHRGGGVFDAFEILVGVRVRSDSDEVGYRSWDPATTHSVMRPALYAASPA